jgi:hypothetical protein
MSDWMEVRNQDGLIASIKRSEIYCIEYNYNESKDASNWKCIIVLNSGRIISFKYNMEFAEKLLKNFEFKK